ncbi:MAG TPA: hypothetical protein V6C52_06550 [Coleofasciculaceae cyanobacterium]|jgi:hypothetical protein
MQVNMYSSHAVLFGAKKPGCSLPAQADAHTVEPHVKTRGSSWLKALAALPLLGMLAQPAMAADKASCNTGRKLTMTDYYYKTSPAFKNSSKCFPDGGYPMDRNWKDRQAKTAQK